MKLSRTEAKIVPLVAEGMSDEQIAGVLGVSARTVQGHLERLAKRTPAEFAYLPRRRRIVVAWAVSNGFGPLFHVKQPAG